MAEVLITATIATLLLGALAFFTLREAYESCRFNTGISDIVIGIWFGIVGLACIAAAAGCIVEAVRCIMRQ